MFLCPDYYVIFPYERWPPTKTRNNIKVVAEQPENSSFASLNSSAMY